MKNHFFSLEEQKEIQESLELERHRESEMMEVGRVYEEPIHIMDYDEVVRIDFENCNAIQDEYETKFEPSTEEELWYQIRNEENSSRKIKFMQPNPSTCEHPKEWRYNYTHSSWCTKCNSYIDLSGDYANADTKFVKFLRYIGILQRIK